MPLGPGVPEFRDLCAALERLSSASGAVNAVVLDTWYELWCRARVLSFHDQDLVISILRRALGSTDKPLQQGGRVHWVDPEGDPPSYAVSFAGVYVLVLWFDGPLRELGVRRAVNQAMPTIQALTIALPPPDGLAVGSGLEPSRSHVRPSLPPEPHRDPAAHLLTAEQLTRFGLFPEAIAQYDAVAEAFLHAAPAKSIPLSRTVLELVKTHCPELLSDYRHAWLRLAKALEAAGQPDQAAAARLEYERIEQPPTASNAKDVKATGPREVC
jgi:hypothetical protein